MSTAKPCGITCCSDLRLHSGKQLNTVADKQCNLSRRDPLTSSRTPCQWWNRMRSSCWNVPAVSVLRGLIGRVFFFFYLQNPLLADKRVLASDPEQLPSRRGLRRWECPAGAAVAGEKKKRTEKTRFRPLPGSWPPQWMYLAVLGPAEAPVSLLSVFRGSLSSVQLSGSSDGCWGSWGRGWAVEVGVGGGVNGRRSCLAFTHLQGRVPFYLLHSFKKMKKDGWKTTKSVCSRRRKFPLIYCPPLLRIPPEFHRPPLPPTTVMLLSRPLHSHFLPMTARFISLHSSSGLAAPLRSHLSLRPAYLLLWQRSISNAE